MRLRERETSREIEREREKLQERQRECKQIERVNKMEVGPCVCVCVKNKTFKFET